MCCFSGINWFYLATTAVFLVTQFIKVCQVNSKIPISYKIIYILVLIIIIKTVLDWGVLPGNFDVSKLLICKHLENLYYYYAPLAGNFGALTMISLLLSNVLLDYQGSLCRGSSCWQFMFASLQKVALYFYLRKYEM